MITGLSDSSSFNYLKNLHTLFHSGCTNLNSHQECMGVPISPHPCQYVLFVGHFIIFKEFFREFLKIHAHILKSMRILNFMGIGKNIISYKTTKKKIFKKMLLGDIIL